MKQLFLVGFVQNLAILMAFSMVYDYLWMRKEKQNSLLNKIISGILLGAIALLLILTPWTFREGLFFDTRSVLLSISGLFFGFIPTAIAMLTAAIYRILVGGSGTWMGVAVIICSGSIGLLWKKFRPEWRKTAILNLFLMGILVHIVMIGCIIILPADIQIATLKKIWFPVISMYPIATVLLGLLMRQQEINWTNKNKLDASEERWHFALEGNGDGLWDWDIVNNEIFFSNTWKSMLGYKYEEIENNIASWEKLLHPDDYEIAMNNVEKFLSGESDNYYAEYRLKCKDGTYKWILDRGKAISKEKNGKVARCIGTHKDLDSVKKNQEKLQSNIQYTQSLIDALPYLIFILDINGTYLSAQNGSDDSYYLPKNKFIGKNVSQVMPAEIAEKTMCCISAALKQRSVEAFTYNMLLNDQEQYFECKIVPFDNEKIIALVENVTQRIVNEKELERSNRKLKTFATHLQTIREDERTLLAKNIQNLLGQVLIAMKIDISLISLKTNRKAKFDPEIQNLSTDIDRINQLIEKAIDTSRGLMADLQSDIIETIGFNNTMVLELKKIEKKYNKQVIFKTNSEDILISEKQRAIACIHIVLEAVENACLHSFTTSVTVSITEENNLLTIHISDEGKGFNVNEYEEAKSGGILEMEERALFLGGEFSINSEIGRGTSVYLKIKESVEVEI